MKRIISITAAILISASVFAQDQAFTNAHEFFRKRMYREVVSEFEMKKAEGIEPTQYVDMKILAESYRKLFMYQLSLQWYNNTTAFKDEIVPEDLLNKGFVLAHLGKYDEAKQVFLKFKDIGGDPVLSEKMVNSVKWAAASQNYTTDRYLMYDSRIELGGRSMGIAYADGGLIVSVPKEQDYKKKTVFYDLAFARKSDTSTYEDPLTLPGEVEHMYYEGTPNVSRDGRSLYYATNGSIVEKYRNFKLKQGKVDLSPGGVNVLKIYKAKKVAGKWMEIRSMPFNSKEYDCAFPFLSDDGMTLYFASNMPGGEGGFDLYKVKKLTDTTWSKPRNLGPDVNGPLDEMYPYMQNDTLYFSSKGHEGFGGSDIFKTWEVRREWVKPVNLGKPFNSSGDDFSYIVNKDGSSGYLSSNRKDGYDRVYEFYKLPLAPDTISGIALNKINMKPVADVKVVLTTTSGKDSGNVLKFNTIKDGYVQLILEKKTTYTVLFTHEDYQPQKIDIPASEREDVRALFGKLRLSPAIKKDAIVKIDNIYFDLAKATMQESSIPMVENIYNYLNDNSTVIVELSAHTDSRGSDRSNMRLSDARAKTVVDYLIAKGISAERLVPKGYGETKLLNKCANNVECAEEEHQENRRVEMKILGEITPEVTP